MVEDGTRRRIGYQMKRAQHALRLAMDAAVRDLGLTTPQYAALAVLEGEAGLSGAGLARRCFVTPQTMNGILAKLEGAGLVERRRHPEHGRVLQAYLTETGGAVVSRAHALVEAVEGRMLEGLTEHERGRLLVVLRGCAEALERDDGRAGLP
ncbi:MarR family transcriptional regulator [Rubrobacter tropicus]|uniref:MarR family transcriptional regulator n=1 Tax=Rubrobacter tropicus TaxID=2653851 RepID=A0A6G8QEY8_9ACTN|nr:MarR family transcriptional regulator [Rubrobacter tropicus]QIN85008.1 MarR family transcriptional regulator [Rubrobacter tropicus]